MVRGNADNPSGDSTDAWVVRVFSSVTRSHVVRALGEYFREAAVLVGVFGILDALIRERGSAEWIAGTTCTSMLLLFTGISLASKVEG